MNVEYIKHSGNDLMVVNAARVSFDKQKTVLDASDLKLIRYLVDHGHISPFFHPVATLRVKAPIFIARQLFRHKVGLAENEVSRRYIHSEPDIYTPQVWRAKPANGIKQGSDGPLDSVAQRSASRLYQDGIETVLQVYRELLAMGVAPEQARMVLPQSMYTTWVWTGSLYAWARIVKQRTDPSAQQEAQHIAAKIGEIMAKLYPHSWQALVA